MSSFWYTLYLSVAFATLHFGKPQASTYSQQSAEVPEGVPTENRTIVTLSAPGKDLKLLIYNPGGTSKFCVSSTLIIGKSEVVLVDTQFGTNDAEYLVKLIQATGKKLTLVYISYGDPDFYFGNEVIRKAFPDCPIYATNATIQYIRASKDDKLAYWGPTLKEHAPHEVIVPQLLPNQWFEVDGQRVNIVGTKVPEVSYCWIPSAKVVLGGISVFGTNVHLWLADDNSTESRTNWYDTLTGVQNLHPDIVVPSHFFPGAPFTTENVEFTQKYISTAENLLPKTKNADEFVAAMKKTYPNLNEVSHLELSAKVLKGEMKWP